MKISLSLRQKMKQWNYMTIIDRLSYHCLTLCVIAGSVFVTSCNRQPSCNTNADKILVLKEKRELYLLKDSKVLKVYKIALGRNPIGHKKIEGDKKTPEGQYKIIAHNAGSSYYKSLRISYPNEQDTKEAAKLGKSPGGDIMIHGLGRYFPSLGKLHTLHDWTLGCIAVTNEEIDEIFACVKDGTPIEIRP